MYMLWSLIHSFEDIDDFMFLCFIKTISTPLIYLIFLTSMFLMLALVTSVQSYAHGYTDTKMIWKPIIWNWSIDLINILIKIDSFLYDLSLANFASVCNCSDPNDALKTWYNMFMPIFNKHTCIKRKRTQQKSVLG